MMTANPGDLMGKAGLLRASGMPGGQQRFNRGLHARLKKYLSLTHPFNWSSSPQPF